MKTKIALLSLLTLLVSTGCETARNMAPNSWNITYYEPLDHNRDGQTIAFGISGPLPFGKQ